MDKKVLVVEDERGIRELLKLNLGNAGYRVGEADCVDAALGMMPGFRPDLLIVDWNMPGQPGVSLVRSVRGRAETSLLPIIMLTARDSELDKVVAFDLGVDDYVTKPFGVRELLGRVRSLMRRAYRQGQRDLIEIDGLCVDHDERRVTVQGRALALSAVEYRLLHYLVSRPLRVHTRDQLLAHVWQDSLDVSERTVDAYVSRLRMAFEAVGHYPCIETVRSMGYRLVRRSVDVEVPVAGVAG